MLDRKLRVVNENVDNEKEWLKWTKKAFESVYGFEYQGDNLFFARVNLVITNNPKGGLFRGVAVSTACVIIRRTPATQAQSRQKSSKNPRL